MKSREKRAKRGAEIHNILNIIYFWICTRVLVASEQVLVTSQVVGVASEVVPVASRQVLIGYESCAKPGFFSDSSPFASDFSVLWRGVLLSFPR